MKMNRANYAVTEIIGTLLLISMAVSTFTAVTIVIVHPTFSNPQDSTFFVNLEGSIVGNDVIFEHIGGYDLDLNVNITIIVSGGEQFVDLPNALKDKNGDYKWNIGEIVIKDLGDISDMRVEGKIIRKNEIIWQGVLQNGSVATTPYVITGQVEVGKGEARLYMTYNFLHNYSGYIQFLYGPDGTEWNETGWIPQSGSGVYSKNITNLINGTVYNYTARGKYNSHIIWGGNKSFNTDDWIRGDWHFDDSEDPSTAIDSSNYRNNGTINGAIYEKEDVVNGSALKFNGINDYVEVPDDDSLDLTEKISIKGWLKQLENDELYPGKINEIATYKFESLLQNIFEPDIIHVSNDIYAIASRSLSPTEKPSIITYRISGDGSTISKIFNVALDIPYPFEPDIIRIGEDRECIYYAIAYGTKPSVQDATGYLATVKIKNDGTKIETIKKAPFPEYYGHEPRIIHVTGNIYAISNGGSINDDYETGFLITVTIPNSGEFELTADGSVAVMNTFNFEQDYCLETDIIRITDGIYAIAYGVGGDTRTGQIITVGIDNGGTITKKDSFGFRSNDGLEPSFVHVNNEYYAISYGGEGRQGVLNTIKIENDGTIGEEGDIGLPGLGKRFKDKLFFDSTYTVETEIVLVNDNIYAIAYAGKQGMSGTDEIKPYLITVSIDDYGYIGNSIINTYEFEDNYGFEPSIVELGSIDTEEARFFAVTYGAGADITTVKGFLATVGININGLTWDVINKNNAYKISINPTQVTATIKIQGTLKPLSGEITSGWNFIVLTYDSTAFSDQMKLYINGSLVDKADVFGKISTSSDDLIFGRFIGLLDEVAIYSRILQPSEIEEEYYAFGGAQHAYGGGGGGPPVIA